MNWPTTQHWADRHAAVAATPQPRQRVLRGHAAQVFDRAPSRVQGRPAFCADSPAGRRPWRSSFGLGSSLGRLLLSASDGSCADCCGLGLPVLAHRMAGDPNTCPWRTMFRSPAYAIADARPAPTARCRPAAPTTASTHASTTADESPLRFVLRAYGQGMPSRRAGREGGSLA